MDLDVIITHLDNFVDTWTGWGKVFKGLTSLGSADWDAESNPIVTLSSGFEAFAKGSSALSDTSGK